MLITLDLTAHELQTLADFRQQHAEYQRTTSSTPEQELVSCCCHTESLVRGSAYVPPLRLTH